MRSLGLLGERRNQLCIGGREVERREILSPYPSHLLTDLRTRLASQLALKKMQLDGSLGIGVRDGVDLRSDVGIDVELFLQLARKARDE